MSGREAVLGKLRRALGVTGDEIERRGAVAARLDRPPRNLIPARGRLDREGRVALFCQMAEKVSATVRRLDGIEAVPLAVAKHLRRHNLPMRVRTGADPALDALPWENEPHLERRIGASDGSDLVSLSRAVAGVAETGTLVLLSGADNPTTLNFLPDTHIVVVAADDIAGDYETIWERLRGLYGAAELPRTVNLVTGPSRSADIEQTLILGAHGPRALHVLVVG
jgi:L-lactate dehydrogenase complex protein LldG